MQTAGGARFDCMATKNSHCRVVVLVDEAEVVLTLVDSNGVKLDEDKFGLRRNAPKISPRAVATDVYNLLYQCANDAANSDED